MKIKYNGFLFEVIYQDVVLNDGEEVLAKVNVDNQKIYICNSLTKQMKENAILHETIHIINREYGLPDIEEHVNCTANGLYAFIKDNPDLILQMLKPRGGRDGRNKNKKAK